MSGLERIDYRDNAVTEIDGIRFVHGWDKYGRSAYLYEYSDGRTRENGSRMAGMIVRMPRAYINSHGADETYLVSNWRSMDAPARYARTLTGARRKAAENANGA